MITRRSLMLSSAVIGAGMFAGVPRLLAQEEEFEVTLTEEEWRERLTPAQFAILREEATEWPDVPNAPQVGLLGEVSPLNDEKRDGIYYCQGCDLAVYSSEHKYDSGTGWPSFWQSLDNAIRTKPDFNVGYERTECHCRRCGGHFGHIFNDGPPPTGERHCLNGLALYFVPA